MNFVENFNPDKIKDRLNIIKLDTDISHLTQNQKKVINLLIKCAKVLEDVFYLQKYPENLKLREKITETNNVPAIQFYRIMCGPYDHFNNDTPFIQGLKKNNKAGFYPQDITKSKWNSLIKKQPERSDEFTSAYTIIQKTNDEYKPVPYSEYFKEHLQKAHDFLIKSLDFTDNISLKEYLKTQAESFINNKYYESDIKWLELDDNEIVPLLGPFECYEDKFLGYKASFTAFISIKNKDEFNKVKLIDKLLDELQKRLPVPDHYKKLIRGKISKIEIVNVVYVAGDARFPIPTTAFNLPNSQRLRAEYGSKKVLVYNIMEAKFNSVMIPISKLIIDESNQSKITFSSYFNFILLHEISHEMGIGLLKDDNGEFKDVSFYLKDLYTIIEEAKADVMGIYSIIFLLKNSYITDCTLTSLSLIYLINLIRSIRFGTENAHGLGSLLQLNFLIEEGVFIIDEDNLLITVDFHKFEKNIEKLLTIILTLQGEGDYAKSKEFISNYSKNIKRFKKILNKINNLPIDILPWFPIAKEKKPFQYKI